MVFLPKGSDAAAFQSKLRQLVTDTTPFHLLTKTIHSAYDSGIAGRRGRPAVQIAAEATQSATQGFCSNAILFETDAEHFLGSDLHHEIFGPSTIVVQHSSRDQVLAIARSLEGQLTATIHGTEQDLKDFADLVSILETKAGRLLFNGFPTGV